ncbi:MAG: GxxExxY protein [Patescibacteria group bacterium]
MPKQVVSDFLYEKLTYGIRGAIYNVYNTLGFGHKESVYHKSLSKEFIKQGIPFTEEKLLPVEYDGEKVGVYKPDFLVGDAVIVEIKALPYIVKDMESQLINYLKGTGYKLGLLVNFGSSSLDIRRKVWSNNQRKSAEKISENR